MRSSKTRVLLSIALISVLSCGAKTILAEEAGNLKMRWERVHRLIKSEQLEQAVVEAKALIPRLPRPEEGYNLLGVIYESLKKPKEAEEAYLKAFHIQPDSIQTRSNLGTLYATQNRFELAFDFLNPIRKFVRDNPDASFALIRGALLLQKREIAQQVIRALDLQAVQNGSLSLSLASLLQQYDLHREAATYFRRAVELSPDDYRSYYGLGISYFQMRDYEKAKTNTGAALRLNPNLVQGSTLLGKIALEQGSLEEARKWLAESVVQNPANDHALFLLATIAIRESKYLEARGYLERSIAINSNIPEYYFSLVTTYHEIHDYSGALGLARQALTRFPDNPDAFFNVAIELTFVNEFEQAEEYFRKSIEAFEKFPGQKYTQTLAAAKYKLAHQLLRGESSQEAVRLLQEVLTMDPNYLEAYVDLARLKIRLSEYQDACRLLERVIALNPQKEEAHYLLARAFSLAGNGNDAKREYQKFSDLKARRDNSVLKVAD
jgi:protein O-GlcNAc transferase